MKLRFKVIRLLQLHLLLTVLIACSHAAQNDDVKTAFGEAPTAGASGSSEPTASTDLASIPAPEPDASRLDAAPATNSHKRRSQASTDQKSSARTADKGGPAPEQDKINSAASAQNPPAPAPESALAAPEPVPPQPNPEAAAKIDTESAPFSQTQLKYYLGGAVIIAGLFLVLRRKRHKL